VTAKDPLSFFTNARARENDKEGGKRRRTKVFAEAWNEKRYTNDQRNTRTFCI
jgi:hypothetical protein